MVACQTVNISIVLTDEEPSGPASISGYVTDLEGNGLEGATVTVENTNISATTDSTGFFLLEGLDAPGPYFLYVIAPSGYLDTETRESIWVSAGMETALSEPLKLSGKPSVTATYVGSDVCKACHQVTHSEVVDDWEASAHNNSINHDYSKFDATGWPQAGQQ